MRVGLIWGAPRSGTSWLGYLISRHPDVEYRFQPIHAHTFKPRIESDSSKLGLYLFYGRLLLTRDPYVLNGLAKDVNRVKKSVLSKLLPKALVLKETHDLNSIQRAVSLDSNSRLLVVIRNPIYVIESWINAPREFSPEWKLEEEWRWASKKNSEYSGNHFGIEEWIKTTRQVIDFRARNPEQVRIIRYELLRAKTEETMREVLAHFSLPIERFPLIAPPRTAFEQHIDEYSVSRPREKSSSWTRLSQESRAEIERRVREAELSDFLLKQQD